MFGIVVSVIRAPEGILETPLHMNSGMLSGLGELFKFEGCLAFGPSGLGARLGVGIIFFRN